MKRIHFLLTVILILQIIGMTSVVWNQPSAFVGQFWVEWQLLPFEKAIWIDYFFMGLLALSGILRVSHPKLASVPFAIGILLLTETVLRAFQFGSAFSQWTPLTQSSRWGLYLLLGIIAYQGEEDQGLWANWSLKEVFHWAARVFAAMTFMSHGVKALMHNAEFIDYILVVSERFSLVSLVESQARILLTVIGIADLLVALLAIAPKVNSKVLQWTFGYMVFWGLLTAFSRILFYGGAGWDLFLIRAANWGMPLIAYCTLSEIDKVFSFSGIVPHLEKKSEHSDHKGQREQYGQSDQKQPKEMEQVG